MDHATKFQKLVQFRAPESLSDAIDAAAGKLLLSRSEYVRPVLDGLVSAARRSNMRADNEQNTKA